MAKGMAYILLAYHQSVLSGAESHQSLRACQLRHRDTSGLDPSARIVDLQVTHHPNSRHGPLLFGSNLPSLMPLPALGRHPGTFYITLATATVAPSVSSVGTTFPSTSGSLDMYFFKMLTCVMALPLVLFSVHLTSSLKTGGNTCHPKRDIIYKSLIDKSLLDHIKAFDNKT